MKLYSTFSPSHKILYEQFFLKTVPKNFDLCITEEPNQICKSGIYYSQGWTYATKKKIDLFVKACEENIGQPFFYCDVDVQFFDPDLKNVLLDQLEDYDIACQDDILNYNSGVFICNANECTLNMFKQMQIHYNYIDDDQKTLNKYIHMCKAKKLCQRFYTIGFRYAGTYDSWTKFDFSVPKDMVMHHANWVMGIENKITILNDVRSKYNDIHSRKV